MQIITRSNDSLWYYSQLFTIPYVLIDQANPTTHKNIDAGTPIQIPGYRLQKHIVKESESLWEIANHYQLPNDALMLANPFLTYNEVTEGQVINVPKSVDELVVADTPIMTYEKLQTTLQELHTLYPFIHVNIIGQSVLKHDIMELKIGSGKKCVHVNASFHANEWVTTSVIIKFLNEYARAITHNTSLNGVHMLSQYMDTCLSIVPMVNPDGVDLVLEGVNSAGSYKSHVRHLNQNDESFANWKANIRGVDLNKQFPANWEFEATRLSSLPSPRDYSGKAPLTEPEVIALVDYIHHHSFDRVMALHTQGKEIYWGFQGLEPKASRLIVHEFARVSGYKPVRQLDNYAGFKDWYIQTYQKPGFTIELGSGINPLPIEQFPQIYQEGLAILLAHLYF